MEPKPNPEQLPNIGDQSGIEPADPDSVRGESLNKDVQEQQLAPGSSVNGVAEADGKLYVDTGSGLDYALPEAPSIDDIIGPNKDFDVTTSTTMPNRNVSTTSTTSQNIPTTTSAPRTTTTSSPIQLNTNFTTPYTTIPKTESPIPGPVSTTTSAERPSTLPNLTTTTLPEFTTTIPESTRLEQPNPNTDPQV